MISQSESIDKAKEIINSVKGTNTPIEELKDQAIELAALIVKEAVRIQTESEKQQQAQLARMMEDPTGKTFTSSMTDQCFRSHTSSRTADQLLYLIKTMGIPKYLSTSRRLGLRLFKSFGAWMPKLFVGLTKKFLRQETSNLIIPGEEEPLVKHLIKRRKEGVRINLNHLGEAILGEEEAKNRLDLYLSDLKNPYIEYVSIKISTIYSQINPIAQAHSIEILAERLRTLYRTAKENLYTRANGTHVQKFVNLDMEEYKDLELTEILFCKVLSEPEFLTYSAGIVLQSYIPEAFTMQKKITEWAAKRCNQGGAPIKIRIVKGANLAMEQVEASIKNWHQAPFLTKMEVDANYKRMLVYGCRPEHAQAVELGIATHNVFDSALALLLRAQYNLESSVNFEMLEGMADNLRRALQMIVGEILLYCPVSNKDDFQNAMAYLVRRLDENTAPHNFLRHFFGLRPGTKEWNNQVAIFNVACSRINSIPTASRRTQNRLKDPVTPDLFSAFDNEPDTDWSLPENIEWAKSIIANWENRSISTIPLAIGGQRIFSENGSIGLGFSPSASKKELYRYSLADSLQADLAIATSLKAQNNWSKTTPEARSLLLAKIAKQLRIERADLIGAMMLDGGKTLQEADSEISEAIDFAEYYRRNIEEVICLEDVQWSPKGTVLVTPPWNFPCSIPAGCILAALATGNTVIFKPSPQTVLVGWALIQAFWKAGVNETVLQFLTCDDEPVGSSLIKDPRIETVMLTGATETARAFLKMRPGLDLIAETGGKNSMIITSLSDRDLAIKELIHSAFSNAGQKCSACSLAILEAEVYDDPHFRLQLRDAAASLAVGSPFAPQTKVNPLIQKPGDSLLRGLTQLDPDEEWLLKPVQNSDIEHLWSPGIKLGVKEGSFTHQNELFGPVLGIMRADNLSHAIKLANGTPYGLTAGLQSLDPREQALWAEKIEAGNCYINRTITGAIVQRQPFGGCKASSFGRGAKAGGPNFLMQLMHCKEISIPREKGKLSDAVTAIAESIPEKALTSEELHLWQGSAGNYAYFWNGYFNKSHDPSNLVGQDNFLSYRPYNKITVRAQEKDLLVDLLRVVAASITVGCPLEISGSQATLKRLSSMTKLNGQSPFILREETEDLLIDRLKKGEIERLRLLSEGSEKLKKSTSESSCQLQTVGVVANGRIELLNFLREVSLSSDYHRYGYLGSRESEKRKPIL